MKRILIVRFSSIGDIVLCTPVIRSLRQNYPSAKIDFLTKSKFQSVLENNPYLNHVFGWDNQQNRESLNDNRYDLIVDLHKNLRSLRIRLKYITSEYITFDKANLNKWMFVKTRLPRFEVTSIVHRYRNMIERSGRTWAGDELDYFHFESLTAGGVLPNNYTSIVLGGTYHTKRIPLNWLRSFISQVKDCPFVLLGGPEEMALGDQIQREFPRVINLAGKCTLPQSATVLRDSNKVITGDTGLAHIAAALGKPMIWLWGSTTPKFGMQSPSRKGTSIISKEINDIKCRPCSKLGFDKCPQGHFKCMSHNIGEVISDLENL